MSEYKEKFLEKSKTYWNPGKTQDWIDMDADKIDDRWQTGPGKPSQENSGNKINTSNIDLIILSILTDV